MFSLAIVTLKGFFRDRVFHGILVVAAAFSLIPSLSTLSMRQVTELGITLSLSLISFILLLLSVFLGGVSLWRDVERRYTFSVLGLPLRRDQYLLGKFLGVSLFLILTSLVLGAVGAAGVAVVSSFYPPDRPVIWGNFFMAIVFNCLMYIIVAGFAFLFSTVSTSFFLPIFGTLCIYLAGNITQEVRDYIHSAAGEHLPAFTRYAADGLYYVVPNLAAFNLKIQAVYSLQFSGSGVLLTLAYFVLYLSLILTCAVGVFSRRDMK